VHFDGRNDILHPKLLALYAFQANDRREALKDNGRGKLVCSALSIGATDSRSIFNLTAF
jgi:hypothetical protein